jgi:hypothetical protein
MWCGCLVLSGSAYGAILRCANGASDDEEWDAERSPFGPGRGPAGAVDDGAVRAACGRDGDGGRWAGDAGRDGDEALGEEDTAVVQRQDPGGFCGFESKLEQYGGNLGRSAVELAKDWRTDKLLRQLQALLIVADTTQMFLLSGDGDVIEPDPVGDGLIATIGSGGSFALAAATALMENTEMGAREIVERSMKIAAEICIYSNTSVTVEELRVD